MKLSVIIPTFRRPNTLRCVLNSFLFNHRTINQKVFFEIIVVESDPIPETAAVVEQTRELFPNVNFEIKHLEKELFGYVKKIIEGLSHATGDYILTLTDEDFTQYDFLSTIFAHIEENTVYPVPLISSPTLRKRYSEVYPKYFRHGVPAFPHYVCSRTVAEKLILDIGDYTHYVTDHHIPLLCWEMGIKVVFVPSFLHISPLFHVQSEYSGDAKTSKHTMSHLSQRDRRLLADKWPLERKRRAVNHMSNVLKTISMSTNSKYKLVSCAGEILITLADLNGAKQISPYYTDVTGPLSTEQMNTMLSDDRLNYPLWTRWVNSADEKREAKGSSTRIVRRAFLLPGRLGRKLRAGINKLERISPNRRRLEDLQEFRYWGPKRISGTRRYLQEFSSRQVEYDQLCRVRLNNFVKVDQPLVLISQINRSGGTLLSQLFDGHPECHAHPHELYIGFPGKSSWPHLNSSDNSEVWFETLFERPTLQFFREGYQKYSVGADDNPDVYQFLLLPALQREIFNAYLNSMEITTQRDILNAYMTSYFNAWLDNQNLNGHKKIVTGFVPATRTDSANSKRFFADYPDGKLVSIVREPKNWYASAQRHSPNGFGDVHEALRKWKVSAEAILDDKLLYGNKVYVISFEQLVQETATCMRSLAEFLGIEFSDKLLTPTFNGHPIKADSSFRVKQYGIIRETLTRFKDVEDEEIAIIDSQASHLYGEVLRLVN